MLKALVAAVVFSSAAAMAQASNAPAVSADGGTLSDSDSIRREIDRQVAEKVEEAKRQLREELRGTAAATPATAAGPTAAGSAARSGSQVPLANEDDMVEKRRLELFVPSGYLRMRPELFYHFDLGRPVDPMGYPLFPHTGREHTIAGANMRFRFEPTLNISEEVRIKTQVDVLDNLLLGSTPDYSLALSDRYSGSLLSESVTVPQYGVNSLVSSIAVKRVWGEVSTPVGVLRFGRMANQWGLGVLHNDGNCIDCDHGETVDRAQFVFEPIPGYFIIPMIDFNAEGLSTQSLSLNTSSPNQAQPFDLTNSDDSHSLVLALARKDTDVQARARIEQGLSVFNYGVHFTYRNQRFENVQTSGLTNDAYSDGLTLTRYKTNSNLYLPDIWIKYDSRHLRLELEGIGAFGNIGLPGATDGNPTSVQNISIVQFGAVVQAELKLLDGALHIGLEGGYASGDKSPGLGNRPNRKFLNNAQGTYVTTPRGSIDGPQYSCTSATVCPDGAIRNFRFNQDYRVDLILWREILGGLTDAVYAKPSVSYTITDGLSAWFSPIYSRTIYSSSAPSGTNPNLGIELDVGVKYETEDGFYAALSYGVLFPLPGLKNNDTVTGAAVNLDIAQAVRGNIGIRF